MASPEKQFERAVQAYQDGKFIAARKIVAKLEATVGAHPQILHLKAFIEVELGTPANATTLLSQVANHFPDDGNVFNAFGISLRKSGRYQESAQAHRRAIELNPSDAAFHQNFGNLLSETGQLEDAITAYKQALKIDPGISEVAFFLAADLNRMGHKDDAVAVFEAQIERDPENIELRLSLANMEHQSANYSAARDWYDSVAEIQPDNARAADGLMSIGVLQGEIKSAITEFRDWHSRYGKSKDLGSSYVHALNYLPEAGPDEIRAAAEANSSNLKVPGSPPIRRGNGRPIKIGIVSRKFGMHPVNYFATPLISASDPSEFQFELFASHVPENDASRSIRGAATKWHDITHMSPEERVSYIRGRNLDVAISPTGHEESEILDLFRTRIAPTQIAAFAVFATTGVSQMDGFLSDNYQTPIGSDAGFTESLIRMPNGYICYQPYNFPSSLTTSDTNGDETVIFGSFNNLAKICDSTLLLWAKVLDSVPGSKLMIKTPALDDEKNRQKFLDRAVLNGIAEDQLILEGPSSHQDLLTRYLSVDVALDPLAYSGGLTTLEALWMGTPVVTLPGNTFARRHSFAHLSVAGLTDWIARTGDQYVEIAQRLASETRSREGFREWLRSRMEASPTTDAHTYAKDFADAIRVFINR